MKIAFYEASGPRATKVDKFIAWITRGRYSHSELIFDDGVAFSAFAGNSIGCIYRETLYDDPSWDVIDIGLDDYEYMVRIEADKLIGIPYDWVGAILSVFRLNFNPSKTKLYCSEAVERVLRKSKAMPWLRKEFQSTPNNLYKKLISKGYKHGGHADSTSRPKK